MSIYTERKCPRKFCESVAEFAQADLGKMARRPWNRFDPTWSPWWLVPSPKQPTHEFGKFYFDWGNKDREEILAGFHVEKGLDPSLAIVYPSKKGKSLIMTKKWIWNTFLEDIARGRLAEITDAFAEAPQLDIEFHVSGGYVQDPAFYQPYEKRYENDCYLYRLEPASRNLVYITAKRPVGTLKAMNKVKTIDDFVAQMNAYDQDQWLWIDCFITARLHVADEQTAPEEICSEEQVWNQYLRHFGPWIK